MAAKESDEVVDATRRTRLADERTYLAWWRTGLTAFAVSAGVGKIVPELAGGDNFLYELAGVGFAILGVAFIVYGLVRHRALERALDKGEFQSLGSGTMLAFSILGAVLGVIVAVLVLVTD